MHEPRITTARRAARAGAVLLVLSALALAATPALAADVPAAPEELELHAGADSSITIEWPAVPGATSYRVYRGTASGAEGTTPIATTTDTEYTDSGLSPTPIYFYQVTAVNAAGESARSGEDASKTPPPVGTGGNVPGVVSGNSLVFYCKDALLGGFDWFQTLTGWFPQVLGSSGAASPGGRVVDMAYSAEGTMTFNNVVVPAAGLYTLDWRYAFQGGLFPGVNNRQMGLRVNGAVVTTTQSFPITGSFEVYQHSALQVQLRAGVNSVQQFAVTDHGLSRVDELIVTPASASSPSGPANLRATPGNASATLTWTASASGAPTSYRVYRGTKSDGEATTPVGTVAGGVTTFTDTGLQNGKQYFYFVDAVNAAGGSPNSNEVTATPAAGTGGGGGGGGGGSLSQGHPATASSVENAGLSAANAVDGSATTRWSSAFADPQWLQVDLGAAHQVNRVVLNWEAAYARAFQIQTSADGVAWTTVYSTTTGAGGTQDLTVTGSGRYVRVYGTQRATQYGYSLYEFQVYGT
ncbi:discoidin domain-containing protein [Dactylosporangium sp. NPDC051484]|uniref:galactose-binding domain-containing protein n=1 Tax=Dactylosporangium sp. NPDC051484 TaxID=3154942 RepID=UPI00344DE6E6